MTSEELYKPTARVGPYMLAHTIGSGSFSKVKLAIHKTTHEQYACKIINKSLILNKTVALHQLHREIEAMKALKHPNTAHLIQVLSTSTKVFIIMELVDGGELTQEILKYGGLSEPYARYLFRQLIDGLEHCHKHGVYHRDLKPENLLLEKDKTLKITDFGLAKLKGSGDSKNSGVTESHTLHTRCGTPSYIAPEVISNGSYAVAKVDIWSCGIILYVLVAATLPFDGDDTDTVLKLILRCDIKYPAFFSPDLIDLISHLLTRESKDRYSIGQVRAHPWFNGPVEKDMYPESPPSADDPHPLPKSDTQKEDPALVYQHPLPKSDTQEQGPAPVYQDSLPNQPPLGQESPPYYPHIPPNQNPDESDPILHQAQEPAQFLPQGLVDVPCNAQLPRKYYPPGHEAVPYHAQVPPQYHPPGHNVVPCEQRLPPIQPHAGHDVIRVGEGKDSLITQGVQHDQMSLYQPGNVIPPPLDQTLITTTPFSDSPITPAAILNSVSNPNAGVESVPFVAKHKSSFRNVWGDGLNSADRFRSSVLGENKGSSTHSSFTDRESEYSEARELDRQGFASHASYEKDLRYFRTESNSLDPTHNDDDFDTEYLGIRKVERDLWNNMASIWKTEEEPYQVKDRPVSPSFGGIDKTFVGVTDALPSTTTSSPSPKLGQVYSLDGAVPGPSAQRRTRERLKTAMDNHLPGTQMSLASAGTGADVLARKDLHEADFHHEIEQRNVVMTVPHQDGDRALKRRQYTVRFKEFVDEKQEDIVGMQRDGQWVRSDLGKMLWCRMMRDFDMIPDTNEFDMDTNALNELWTNALANEIIRSHNSYSARHFTTPVIPSPQHANNMSFRTLLVQEKQRSASSNSEAGRMWRAEGTHERSRGLGTKLRNSSPSSRVGSRSSSAASAYEAGGEIGVTEMLTSSSDVISRAILPCEQENGRVCTLPSNTNTNILSQSTGSDVKCPNAESECTGDIISVGVSNPVVFRTTGQRDLLGIDTVDCVEAPMQVLENGISRQEIVLSHTHGVEEGDSIAAMYEEGQLPGLSNCGQDVGQKLVHGRITVIAPRSQAMYDWKHNDQHLRLGGERDLLSKEDVDEEEDDLDSEVEGCCGSHHDPLDPQDFVQLLRKSTFNVIEDLLESGESGNMQRFSFNNPGASSDIVSIPSSVMKADGKYSPVNKGEDQKVSNGKGAEYGLEIEDKITKSGEDENEDDRKYEIGKNIEEMMEESDSVEQDIHIRSGKALTATTSGSASLRNMDAVSPFLMELPGPRLGTSEPQSGIGKALTIPSMGHARRFFKKNQSLKLRGGTTFTQFHSVLSSERCFAMMQDIVDDFGCTKVQVSKGRTKNQFKIKWEVKREGIRLGGTIHISKRDDLLSDVVFKKNANTDAEKFKRVFSDIYKKYCERMKSANETNRAG